MKFKLLKSDYHALLFLFILLGFFLYRFYYEKTVNENSFETVAFTNDYYHAHRGSMTMRFKYCYKGKIYDGVKSIDGEPRGFIHKLYGIKISKIDPEKYSIDLVDELFYQYSVIDSCLFKNADKELKNQISRSLGYLSEK